MAGMGDGYVGTAQDAMRIRRLEKRREEERRKIEELKNNSASVKGPAGLIQFGSGGTSEGSASPRSDKFPLVVSTTARAPLVAEGDLPLVVVDKNRTVGLPPRPLGGGEKAQSSAIVEYTAPTTLLREEGEDLEVKLRRILENVPVRVSNTSGSSAGSGSGDFHQYRQMRRREQDRLARMDADYQRRKEIAEFELRRQERTRAAEERAAKKRLKRQKKNQRRKEKRKKGNSGGEDQGKEESSDDNGDSENDEQVTDGRTS